MTTQTEALIKIATVNAMDYEYQAWAREALAQPEQEPDATIRISREGSTRTIDNHFADRVLDWPDGEYKLYTEAPQRKPLTDEQILNLQYIAGGFDLIKFARSIEAAHGIKEVSDAC